MTTITNIRDDLITLFDQLKAGDIDPKQAIEMNNTAGKIINSAKTQLAYHALRNEMPEIPFLAGADVQLGTKPLPKLEKTA